MLIVSRKINESILINDNIEITIIKAAKDKVKIGITAPKEINVARKELVETRNLNIEAAKPTTTSLGALFKALGNTSATE